jgi:hypothetical protein
VRVVGVHDENVWTAPTRADAPNQFDGSMKLRMSAPIENLSEFQLQIGDVQQSGLGKSGSAPRLRSGVFRVSQTDSSVELLEKFDVVF